MSKIENEIEINWFKVMEDVSEVLVLTQGDLAKRLNVTQQSVSNWLNKSRIPSKSTTKIVRKLANEAGLNLKDYALTKTAKDNYGKVNQLQPLPANVRRLVKMLNQMPPRKRKNLLADLNAYIEICEAKK